MYIRLSGYFGTNYSNGKRYSKRLQSTKIIYSTRDKKD